MRASRLGSRMECCSRLCQLAAHTRLPACLRMLSVFSRPSVPLLCLHRSPLLQLQADRTLRASFRSQLVKPSWTAGHGCRCHTPSSPRQCSTATAHAASELWLYNSISRRKECFTPRRQDGQVSMYVCGVTVYDLSHIGHARVYTSFDILYRYLTYLGYEVQYVRNFTDIDDKIINRARETGVATEELSSRFIDEFHADMRSLNCLQPSLEPRATDHIEAIIEDIELIMANGKAYQSEGDVFFDVAAMQDYGCLSGRKQEDNRAGERVAVDTRKRSAADFVLWKAAKEDEPQWPSPWGAGRPGWHMECSAMIRRVMGPSIDIHGGGRDLIFPHHENEIAQAQAASGACSCSGSADHAFVNYWIHNGFVNVDSEKMSKSLGNFFTIRDVLRQYHPLALRFFLVSSHYRAPINYTPQNLEAASHRIYYIYQTLSDCHNAIAAAPGWQDGSKADSLAQQLQATLHDCLSDDLNTSAFISTLSEPLKRINDFCHTKKGKKDKHRTVELPAIFKHFQQALGLLGLWKADISLVLREMKALALVRAELTEQDITNAIERRAEARKAKDFAAADSVRDEILQKGIQIMDTPQGTTWRPNPALQEE